MNEIYSLPEELSIRRIAKSNGYQPEIHIHKLSKFLRIHALDIPLLIKLLSAWHEADKGAIRNDTAMPGLAVMDKEEHVEVFSRITEEEISG